MAQIKLYLHQGDSKSWPVTVTDTGSPPAVDLTGVTLSGDIRLEYDSDVVGSFSFTETDMANGQFSIDIDSVVSAALPVTGVKTSFVFDIQFNYGGSPAVIKTPISGYLIVSREVTRG